MILNNKGRYIKERQTKKKSNVWDGLQERMDKIVKRSLIEKIMNRYSGTKDITPREYKNSLETMDIKQLLKIKNNL